MKNANIINHGSCMDALYPVCGVLTIRAHDKENGGNSSRFLPFIGDARVFVFSFNFLCLLILIHGHALEPDPPVTFHLQRLDEFSTQNTADIITAKYLRAVLTQTLDLRHDIFRSAESQIRLKENILELLQNVAAAGEG